MIFEQIHKQVFDSEVLKSEYIVEFLNEIRNAHSIFIQKRKEKTPFNKTEDILDKLYQTLQDLDEEINFQYSDVDQDYLRRDSGETND